MKSVFLIGVGVLSAVIAGCGPLPQPTAQEIANDAKFGTEVDAIVAAQKTIRRFLKHPHDASFSWGTSARLTEPYGADGRRNWVVAGKVQAPNDFGANLTKPYQATMCVVGGQWECLIAFLDGKTVYQNGELIEAAFADLKKPAAIAEPTAEQYKNRETTQSPRQEPQPTAVDTAEAIRKRLETSREGKPLYTSRNWVIRSKPVVGKLKSYGAGKVKIETAAGETLDLTPDDLSPGDLKFVNDHLH
jgi:hypothetical protein